MAELIRMTNISAIILLFIVLFTYFDLNYCLLYLR